MSLFPTIPLSKLDLFEQILSQISLNVIILNVLELDNMFLI